MVSGVCTWKQKLWKQVMVCVLWFLVCACNMNCDSNSGIITSPICGVKARQYEYLSWNIFGRFTVYCHWPSSVFLFIQNILILNMICIHEFGCCFW